MCSLQWPAVSRGGESSVPSHHGSVGQLSGDRTLLNTTYLPSRPLLSIKHYRQLGNQVYFRRSVLLVLELYNSIKRDELVEQVHISYLIGYPSVCLLGISQFSKAWELESGICCSFGIILRRLSVAKVL